MHSLNNLSYLCFILVFKVSNLYAIPSENVFAAIDQYQQFLLTPDDDNHQVVNPVWHLRIPDKVSGQVKTYNLSDFQASKGKGSNLKGYFLSNIHFSHDKLALARLDLLASSNTALLVLFKVEQHWQVVADLRAEESSCISNNAIYQHYGEHEQVLTLLGKYYDAVTFETPSMLDDVFDPTWYMKNHEGKQAVYEGVDAFKQRLRGNQHQTYYNHREIADVQVIYQCMALVRIDTSSSGGNTFFVFYRGKQGWRMTDKFWTFAEPK